MDTKLRYRMAATTLGLALAAGAAVGPALPARAAGLPDLSIRMTASASSVPANGEVTYTLTVINAGSCVRTYDPDTRTWYCEPGGADVTNVGVWDTLPAGTTFLRSASDSGFTCAPTGGAVACTGGRVANGAVGHITIAVRAPNAGATLTSSASVDPGQQIPERDEANNSATVAVTVTPPPPPPPPLPDLTISGFTQAPSPAAVNGTVTYTIKVTNAGKAVARDVRLHWQGTWDGWYQGTHTGDSGFACHVPPEYADQDVRCLGGSIAVGATATISVTAKGPPTSGSYGATATVDPYGEIPESNEANNARSLVTRFG